MKIARDSLGSRLVYGVIGTANTGKTTFIGDLVEATSRRPPRLRFGKVGRDYREEVKRLGLSINRNGSGETQSAIFDILYGNTELAVGNTYTDRVVMDRTPLDAYVYTLWHIRYGKGGIDDDVLRSMEGRVWRAMNRIDRIFWIPMSMCGDVKVVDDRLRDTDPMYRKQIDILFRKTLASLNLLSHVTILHGTRDERVKLALEQEKIDRMVCESQCISMQRYEKTWTEENLEALGEW